MFTFINEVRIEIGKVTWPTRQETVRLTLIVILLSLAVGVYLGLLDLLFTEMLQLLIA